MSFYIKFLDDDTPDFPQAAYAELCLNDYKERLYVSLIFWNVEQYRVQWLSALERFEQGYDNSLLIVSYYEGDKSFCWPMWREGGTIYFQNHLIDLANTLDISHICTERGARVDHNDDGERISEWSISSSDIADFIASNPAL